MSDKRPNPASGGRRAARRTDDSHRAWRALRPLAVFLISLALCAAVIFTAYHFLMDRFFYPVDINDATPITITVPSGYGASSIARILYEAGGKDEDGNLIDEGLISSKTLFKIYVDFTGKSDKLRAGTYVLSRNMDVEQIVDTICNGNPPRATVKFTIIEGMAVEDIAEKLVSVGLLDDTDAFLDLCKTGEGFEYTFLTSIEPNPEQARDYLLEGYLFPDTYEVYADASEKAIVNRMLYRFFEVFSDKYISRAQELGMSIDEVVSLASLIEKEARTDGDFPKVSAVFHNRLKKGMKLQSDAPLKYIYKSGSRLVFTSDEMQNPSLYNTYVHEGLPLGPIANPGRAAIEAALYPDENFMAEGYYYFCLMDSETGALVYAKTLEEHEKNIALYRPGW